MEQNHHLSQRTRQRRYVERKKAAGMNRLDLWIQCNYDKTMVVKQILSTFTEQDFENLIIASNNRDLDVGNYKFLDKSIKNELKSCQDKQKMMESKLDILISAVKSK